MDTNVPQPKPWSSTQAYAMAVVSLILGVAVGYLSHTPKGATAVPAVAAVPRPQAVGMNTPMPSPESLKNMADKQVAPLLAELEKNPRNTELLNKIGGAYLAANQYPIAKQYYEQSLAIKSDPNTMNALSFVYYSTGDVDKAIATLNDALKLDAKNPQFLYNLGMYEWHGKSDPQAAIAAWQRFIKANPDNPKRTQVEQMIAQAKRHLNIAPGTKTDKPTM
ncbi:MAG TPA: tetratricopeptide repeat protein [Terriglobales bacterium]|nr:tetratricopeptide repeat protein [Terriglobales bacterium]